MLSQAAGAGMNFIRVWGGGGIEKQAFYDACDRHGIMVYQETMHSQAMPTRDVNFANERGEVAQMINKISSHPSVVRYGCASLARPLPRFGPRIPCHIEREGGQSLVTLKEGGQSLVIVKGRVGQSPVTLKGSCHARGQRVLRRQLLQQPLRAPVRGGAAFLRVENRSILIPDSHLDS